MTLHGSLWTTDELNAMPTLSSGWCGDLKFDDGETRVWLYRVGLADGAPFENTVVIERLSYAGRWETSQTYNGDDITEDA